MADIDTFYLLTQTRANEQNTQTANNLRLFSGTTEILEFGSPPARGKAGLLSANPGLTNYEDFIQQPIFLASTGSDAWAPRSILLYGDVIDGQNSGLRPLGVRIRENPSDIWLSQLDEDVPRTTDRLALETITYASPDDPMWTFVLMVHTGKTKSGKSQGPFQFTVYARVSNISVVAFQTILPKEGLQEPAETDGYYMHTIRLNMGVLPTVADLLAAELVNLSDDAWFPRRTILFAYGTRRAGRVLGQHAGGHWVSLDPADHVPNPAWLNLTFRLGGS